MILGVDASNLRAGGGVTHLVEVLRAADPPAHSFDRVLVWSGRATLDRLEDRPWLEKSHVPALDGKLAARSLWQRFELARLARRAGCGLLFAPGGVYQGDFHPAVTMSRNMLPFEWRELRRFGRSWMTLKLAVLRVAQARSFRRVDGLIFLTRYARQAVMPSVGTVLGKVTTIPHGVDGRFFAPPREQAPLATYSLERPFRLLYVSVVDVYKHQWHVAEAVARLRSEGLPVELEIVGPSYGPAQLRLERTLDRVDPFRSFVRQLGAVPHGELHARYARADLCLFASSCENMPNILLEGMASGLPIACSSRGPMPEILGEAGVYFDPEVPGDIARAVRTLACSHELRTEKARASFEAAHLYSWARCASETFAFLAEVAGAGRAGRAPLLPVVERC